MSINLSKYIPDLDDTGEIATEILDEVIYELNKLGINTRDLEDPPKRTLPDSSLLRNIANISDKNIRNYHAEFTIAESFLREQAIIAECIRNATEKKLKDIESLVRSKLTGTETRKRDLARQNKLVKKLSDALLKAEAMYKILQTLALTADNNRKLCSRDTEYRKMEFEAYKRDGSISNIKKTKRPL
jgi:hypothetical protein